MFSIILLPTTDTGGPAVDPEVDPEDDPDDDPKWLVILEEIFSIIYFLYELGNRAIIVKLASL